MKRDCLIEMHDLDAHTLKGGKTFLVEVPPQLENMRPHLQAFVEGMIVKLWHNRHKTTPAAYDVLKFFTLMQKEVVELCEQCMADRMARNVDGELCDIANFAFLMSFSLDLERAELARQAEEAEHKAASTWLMAGVPVQMFQEFVADHRPFGRWVVERVQRLLRRQR